MARFFAKRLATLVLTLLVVSFLVFLTFELSPSDLARTALGQFATKAQLEAYHVEYGLDRPFFERYLKERETPRQSSRSSGRTGPSSSPPSRT